MTDPADRQEIARQLAALMSEYRKLHQAKAASYIELVDLALDNIIKIRTNQASPRSLPAKVKAREALRALRDWLRKDMENP